jgi:hypothetical protein
MTKRSYDDLPFVPTLIAKTICEMTYDGKEINNPSASEVAKIEALRLKMTRAEVDEFAAICDLRCRTAFESKAAWLEKCIKANGNLGRDQFYLWMTHWMTAYLQDPAFFKKECGYVTPACVKENKRVAEELKRIVTPIKSDKEIGEEFAAAFSNFVNSFSKKPKEIAVAKMIRDHRSLQQSMMRFFLMYVEEMSKNGSDARNAASVELAKEIMKIDQQNRFLPSM